MGKLFVLEKLSFSHLKKRKRKTRLSFLKFDLELVPNVSGMDYEPNMNDLHSIFLDLREHCYSGKSQKLTGTSAHAESDNGSGKISFLRTARGSTFDFNWINERPSHKCHRSAENGSYSTRSCPILVFLRARVDLRVKRRGFRDEICFARLFNSVARKKHVIFDSQEKASCYTKCMQLVLFFGS